MKIPFITVNTGSQSPVGSSPDLDLQGIGVAMFCTNYRHNRLSARVLIWTKAGCVTCGSEACKVTIACRLES